MIEVGKIKSGDYVRTQKGKIIKCTGFGKFRKEGQPDEVDTIISGHSHYIYDNITKHSKNLIDLIEVRRLCKWRQGSR